MGLMLFVDSVIQLGYINYEDYAESKEYLTLADNAEPHHHTTAMPLNFPMY